MFRLARRTLPVAGALIILAGSVGGAAASSHREAPLVSKDAFADNTDTYVFISPTNPNNVVIAASWIPFEGPEGGASLLDLFAGRRQLIVYRAFFEPGVHGWPDHACPGCSLVADQVAHVAHLNARDTTLVFASRAPQPDIARVKARMDWTMPWYTMTDDFDADFGVDEWHGTNAFIRDGDRVFRTYFVNNRGDEAMGGTWAYLDLTALGRQESWEDSPEGHPQTPPYEWWNWHDEYGDATSS